MATPTIVVPGAGGSGTLGTLAYVQTTTNQTGITSAADLTGLTATVTVGAGRRIRITGYVEIRVGSAGAVPEVLLYIYEGGSLIGYAAMAYPQSGNYATLMAVAVLTPSTGSHTYKLQAQVTSGNGDTNPGANNPQWILVEDIGT